MTLRTIYFNKSGLRIGPTICEMVGRIGFDDEPHPDDRYDFGPEFKPVKLEFQFAYQSMHEKTIMVCESNGDLERDTELFKVIMPGHDLHEIYSREDGDRAELPYGEG